MSGVPCSYCNQYPGQEHMHGCLMTCSMGVVVERSSKPHANGYREEG